MHRTVPGERRRRNQVLQPLPSPVPRLSKPSNWVGRAMMDKGADEGGVMDAPKPNTIDWGMYSHMWMQLLQGYNKTICLYWWCMSHFSSSWPLALSVCFHYWLKCTCYNIWFTQLSALFVTTHWLTIPQSHDACFSLCNSAHHIIRRFTYSSTSVS